MDETIDLGIRLKADGSGLVGEVRVSAAELDKLTDSARRAGAAADQQTPRWGKFSREIDTSARSVANLRVDLFSLQGAIAALGLGAAAREVAQAGIAMEGYRNALQAVTGSQQLAAEEIRFVRAEAERLGLQFTALQGGYTKLAAAAQGTVLQGQATRDIFTAVAEASAVMRLSADQTTGTIRALEQMISKGQVTAEELRQQLGDRLPGAFQIMTRAAYNAGLITRNSTAELDSMLETGQLLADQVLPAFGEELRRSVAAGLPEAIDSSAASFNRLQNAIFDVKLAAAQGGFLDLLAAGADGLADALRNLPLLGISMVRGVLGAFGEIQQAAELAFAFVQDKLEGLLDNIRQNLATLLDEQTPRTAALGGLLGPLAAGLPSGALDLNDYAQVLRDQAAASPESFEQAQQRILAAGEARRRQLIEHTDALADAFIAEQRLAGQVDELADSTVAAAKGTGELTDAQKKARAQADELIDALQFERAQLQRSDRERAVEIAARRLSADATAQQVAQVRELAGALFDEQQASRAAERAREELLRQQERTAEELKRQQERQAEEQARILTKPIESAFENIQSAGADFFYDLFQGGIDSARDFASAVKDIILRMFAELAAAQLFRGIVPQLAGGFGLGGFGTVANVALPGGGLGGGFGFSPSSLLTSAGGFIANAGTFIGQLPFLPTGLANPLASGIEALGFGLQAANPFGLGAAGLLGGLAGDALFGGHGGTGGSIGAAAGFALGGPVGALIGGLGGGFIGGLFGNDKPGRPRFGANLDLSTGAFQSFTRDHVKDDFIDGVGQVAQAAVAQANVLLASLGLAPVAGNLQFGTFQGRAAFALPGEQFGAPGGAFEQLRGLLDPKFANVAGRTFGTVGGRTSTPSQATYDAFSAGLTEALLREAALDAGGEFARIANLSSGAEALQDNLAFLAEYNALIEINTAAGLDFNDALAAINARWNTAEATAKSLGLALDPIVDARNAEIAALREQVGLSQVAEFERQLTSTTASALPYDQVLTNATEAFRQSVLGAFNLEPDAVAGFATIAGDLLAVTAQGSPVGTDAYNATYEMVVAVTQALAALQAPDDILSGIEYDQYGEVLAGTRAYEDVDPTTATLEQILAELKIPGFAAGGIATSPAIFGEAGPEAAVPLPDGRRIPVLMSTEFMAPVVNGLQSVGALLSDDLHEVRAAVERLDEALRAQRRDAQRDNLVAAERRRAAA